jgi:hypothetical protein
VEGTFSYTSDEPQLKHQALQNTAMLPFGDRAGPPGKPGHQKAFSPVEDRVKVFFSD